MTRMKVKPVLRKGDKDSTRNGEIEDEELEVAGERTGREASLCKQSEFQITFPQPPLKPPTANEDSNGQRG
jgi:hypothetical protein